MKIEDSHPNSSPSLGKAKRARKPRKQPLLALGDRRVGMDLSSKDTSQQLLQATSMSDDEKSKIYKKLTEDLTDFLSNAGKNWNSGEECRRFTIFGDCIVCAQWKGKLLVSGSDIVKSISALYRLANMGKLPRDQRKFEESVAGDLRGLKVGSAAFLEEANSPLLRFLFRLSSVRTHKRQKIFFWNSVPFMTLFLDAMSRERKNSLSSLDSKTASEVSPIDQGQQADFSRGTHHLVVHSLYRSPNLALTEDGAPSAWTEPRASYALYVPKALQCLPPFRKGHEEITKLAIIADAALDIETAAEAAITLAPVDETAQHGSPHESLPSIKDVLSQEL